MAEQKTSEAKPGLDIKKILSIAFAAVNIIVVGGGAYLVFVSTLGHKSRTSFEDEMNAEMIEHRKMLSEAAILYAMDPFNTNLEGLPRRFIRVEMSVEMYDKEGFEELVTLGGASRDAIVRILNGTQLTEVETVQGKLRLKNEIIAHLNDSLKRGVVKNIYFTKFQVQ